MENVQLVLHDEEQLRVSLNSAEKGQNLYDAAKIVLRGDGYATQEDAARDGGRWRDVVSRAFALMHLAADFSDQDPSGVSVSIGQVVFSEHLRRHLMADFPGITVFEDQSGLLLATAGELSGCVRPSSEKCRSVLFQAERLHEPLKDSERLAFDLYSGSFFQPSADARLLMLTMAIETLLDLQPRSDAAHVHVAAMIEATEANVSLAQAERDSIRGTLNWLYKESIGQAGRALARTLEPRTYDSRKPAAFFTRCYDVRSALTHGHVPRPDYREVNSLAGSLELFVGDLLAGRLLHATPDDVEVGGLVARDGSDCP
ncbi:hypothetical protein [Streptomyces sp. NPDC002564]|uniref:hypothetical protein n=1 Tax=Streptomyces sp. NPDC002564 TaxID=3364649 RepID=UPI0036A63189